MEEASILHKIKLNRLDTERRIFNEGGDRKRMGSNVDDTYVKNIWKYQEIT